MKKMRLTIVILAVVMLLAGCAAGASSGMNQGGSSTQSLAICNIVVEKFTSLSMNNGEQINNFGDRGGKLGEWHVEVWGRSSTAPLAHDTNILTVMTSPGGIKYWASNTLDAQLTVGAPCGGFSLQPIRVGRGFRQ